MIYLYKEVLIVFICGLASDIRFEPCSIILYIQVDIDSITSIHLRFRAGLLTSLESTNQSTEQPPMCLVTIAIKMYTTPEINLL